MKKFLSIFLILALLSALMIGCSSPAQNGNGDIPDDQDSLPTQNGENNNPATPDDSQGLGGDENIDSGDVGGEEESSGEEESDVVIREIIDTPYEPAPEGFIGIAFYPVKEGENYPYDIGEKVTNMEKWKYVYSLVDYDATIEQGKIIGEDFFDDNVISRYDSFSKQGYHSVEGTYESTATGGYWGYVYKSGDEIYIVATHDAFKPSDDWGAESKEFHFGSLKVRLRCRVITEDSIPEYYEIGCKLVSGVNCVTNCKEADIPDTVTASLEGEFSELQVRPYANDPLGGKNYNRFLYTTSVDELYTADDGGIVHEFNGYKNGESYLYRITVYAYK